MRVVFYLTTDDKKVVHKRCTFVGSYDVELKQPCDILRPNLILRGIDINVNTINYVYCSTMMRFYYITKKTLLQHGLIELELEVDPLMSFQTNIENLYALIDRQEFNYQPYVEDDQFLTRTDRHIYQVDVGHFDTTQRFILNCAGVYGM